ncbi:MAG: SRPBCC family protein [Actinomycetota bacterium]
MTGRQGALVVEESATVDVPIDRAWHAIIDSAARSAWWSYLSLEAEPGGRFEERWTDEDGRPKRTRGSVLALVPPELLRLSWADDDWPGTTEVEVRLHRTGGATTIQVRQRGWEGLDDGEALAEEHRAGWKMHLANLRNYLRAESL